MLIAKNYTLKKEIHIKGHWNQSIHAAINARINASNISSIFHVMSLLYHLSYSAVCECMLFCVWCPINAFCFACSYGMRYIAKVLKNSLHEKFPDASEDELMKVEALGCINMFIFSIHSTVFCSYRWGGCNLILRKVLMMRPLLFMADCRKPAVLPLHESSHRGPWRLRHHRHVSWRAASLRPAS